MQEPPCQIPASSGCFGISQCINYNPMQCRHYLECGGCTQQHLPYEEQLRIKSRTLKEVFSPILLDDPTILQPIIPSPLAWRYRNKMEFSFSQDKAGCTFLGLMKRQGRVVDLEECHLVSSWYLKVLQGVREWWQQSGLEAYHWKKDTGSLRTLTLREGVRTGEKLIMLTISGNPDYALRKKDIEQFVKCIAAIFPANETVSLFLRIQQIQKKRPTQFYEWHLAGPDHIWERLHIGSKDYHFRMSPSSFFQPNPLAAEKIYEAAHALIPQFKTHILDLYAGSGALSLIFAERAHRITAVEINPYAIFDAEENLRKNDIANVSLHLGDVNTLLPECASSWEVIPDLVIVDPPRSGLNERMLDMLLHLRPKEILYISCNPATQSPNLQTLASGYQVIALQPIDQFPHTSHIENIALLRACQ